MIRRLMINYYFTITALLFVTLSTSVYSEEVRYPIPCYEGKELEKVREWEKKWVGKRIDSSNVDEVKEFLPETLYTLTKDTGKWGESWFEIVPYREYKMTAGTIEATKKYSPDCRIGEQEELLNWVAGYPFPEPKMGIEIAWNFYSQTRGDTQLTYAPAYIVDGRRKSDRHIAFKTWVTFFSGRRDVSPTPEVVPNPKKIYRAAFAEFSEPSEMKGFLTLMMTYKDFLLPYDTWTWVASIRRIRRVSTAQRVDTVGGQDLCYDDNYGWDGTITRNSYKLIGRKEILSARHQDVKLLEHMEGDCLIDGRRKERINAWVVEAVCKDPGYIYKKNTWYVDPESWQIIFADKYDKYGRYWKSYEESQGVYKGYKEQDIYFFCNSSMIDHQRIHATVGTSDSQIGIEIPPETFTIKYLQKYGR